MPHSTPSSPHRRSPGGRCSKEASDSDRGSCRKASDTQLPDIPAGLHRRLYGRLARRQSAAAGVLGAHPHQPSAYGGGVGQTSAARYAGTHTRAARGVGARRDGLGCP
eukprot:3095670-Pleurochrysis_carterae.AAC.2